MKTVRTLLASLVCLGLLVPYARAVVPVLPPDNTNLCEWTFTDTNWYSDCGYAPISFTNLSSSVLGNGSALVLDTTNAVPAWLAYNCVELDGWTNLTVDSGTLMFWVAANSWSSTNLGGTGPGQSGRLIEIGSYTTNVAYGWWSLYTDPEGANLYFSAQGSGGSEITYLSAPIAWTTNRWHHVALVYSSINSELYLDGNAVVTNGAPVTVLPGPDVLSQGFRIGSDSNGVSQARCMFDDLLTYDYPLDAGSIQSAFDSSEIIYLGNPLNLANITQLTTPPSYPTNTPTFRAVMGGGFVKYVGAAPTCVTNSNIWMTNIVAEAAANGTMNLSFTVQGGDPTLVYDVYGTAALMPGSITNAQWYWLGQVNTCGRYSVTNLPPTAVSILLGWPTDADGDGLPNAFESLVSKTDPNNPDSYGDGLLDGWRYIYYGTNSVDPYSLCPCDDGWTLLQAYQNGWNPNDCHTPPAPTGLAVSYYGNGGSVRITWSPSPGPVLSYTLERYVPQYDQTNDFTGLAANSTLYLDSAFPVANPIQSWYLPPYYRIMAHYAVGDSAWSQPVPIYPFAGTTDAYESKSIAASLTRGPGGVPYLMVSGLTPEIVTVRFLGMNLNSSWTDATWVTLDLPVSGFTNGGYALTASQAATILQTGNLDGNCFVETMDSSSRITQSVLAEAKTFGVAPFYDGREQLKENLAFLLRAADCENVFSLGLAGAWPRGTGYPYGTFPAYTDYTYSGLYDLGEAANQSAFSAFLNEYVPYINNFAYRNFVFTTSDVDPNTGWYTTGAGYYGPWSVPNWSLSYPPAYLFQTSCVQCALSPLLLPSESRWILADTASYANCGVTVGLGTSYPNPGVPDYQFYLENNVSNLFGLQFVSLNVGYTGMQGMQYAVLYPGGAPLSVAASEATTYVYPQTAQPNLRTVGYYFCRPNDGEGTDGATDLLPGHSAFSPTNTTPLMIIPANKPFKIAGYAKQVIDNGDPTKFAYLGQYFDQAYLANPDGTPSTNQTGLLSEYGEFLPTEPGTVVLTTNPDLSQTNDLQGQCTINVVKLQLDVNHDGVMDLSFGGPDNTSQARPFVFWVNNDCDWNSQGYDRVGQDVEVSLTHPPDYSNTFLGSERDLEDWARLWICGVPALPVNQGYTVTLSMSAQNGSPAVNLVDAAETNGGTLYLSDSNTAFAQLFSGGWYRQKYPTLSATPLTLPGYLFTNAGNKYFLFEGAGIGQGQLTMTISQNATNVLAQTSVWLDLRDVKNMYERVHIEGVTNSVPPTSFLSSSFQQINGVASGSDEDTNIIVFIHGWRMGSWEYENFSETMFKRLYWQGYHGRFAAIRWPTLSTDDFKPIPLGRDYFTYNQSEFRAWESARGVSDYLTSLKQRFPNYSLNVCSHSMGGIVMAEALKDQLAAGQQNVRNYVLMQAAIPASCYDTSFTNYQPFLQAEQSQPTPNDYLGYPGLIGNAVSGVLVNFYNTNDYALATGSSLLVGGVNWEANQRRFKPDTGLGYTTDGTNCFNARQGYRTVSDDREVMSFCARPRSRAVGAQPNVGGVILPTSQVDLKGNFGFDLDWSEHSAEFNWNIQRLNGFYHTLLNTLIPPGQ